MSSQTSYGWSRAMHVMNHRRSSEKRESVVKFEVEPEKYLGGGL
jgi:hypothetical protein